MILQKCAENKNARSEPATAIRKRKKERERERKRNDEEQQDEVIFDYRAQRKGGTGSEDEASEMEWASAVNDSIHNLRCVRVRVTIRAITTLCFVSYYVEKQSKHHTYTRTHAHKMRRP